MKNKRFNSNEKGAVTVFLSCILAVMIVFETFIIDATKVLTAKNICDDAGRLSSNTVMTHYNRKLYHGYGLFAFDVDEGQASVEADRIFRENLNQINEDSDTVSPLNISADVSVSYDRTSSLNNNNVFEHQIIDQMKYSYDIVRTIKSEDIEGRYSKLKEIYECLDAKIEYDKELYHIFLHMQEARDMMYSEPDNIYMDTVPKMIDKLKCAKVEGEKLPGLYTDFENSVTQIPEKYRNGMLVIGGYSKDLYKADKIDEIINYLQEQYDDAMKPDEDDQSDTNDTEDDEEGEASDYRKILKLNKDKMKYLFDNTYGYDQKIDSYNRHYISIGLQNNDPKNLYFYPGEINHELKDIAPADFQNEIMGRFHGSLGMYDLENYLEYYENHNEKSMEFVESLQELYSDIDNEGDELLIAEYVTNFFTNCAYHEGSSRCEYRGVTTLNGNNPFGDSRLNNVKSVKSLSENEYIITGKGKPGKEIYDLSLMIWATIYPEVLVEHACDYAFVAFCRAELIEKAGLYGLSLPFLTDFQVMIYINQYEIEQRSKILIGEFNGNEDGYGLHYDYIDYMQLFTLLAIKQNKTAVLERMKTVIEANMAYSGENFSFASAYTGMKLNATVSLDTTFMRKDAAYTGGNYDNGGTGRYSFNYEDCLLY